ARSRPCRHKKLLLASQFWPDSLVRFGLIKHYLRVRYCSPGIRWRCPLWVRSIRVRTGDIRFTPKSGHWLIAPGCPLCAKSGHHEHARRDDVAPGRDYEPRLLTKSQIAQMRKNCVFEWATVNRHE